MPNTGIQNGGDVLVYINTGTDIAPVWTPIAHCTESSIDDGAEVRDRVTSDTGKYKGRKVGVQEVTINVSSLTCYDGYSYWDLLALKEAGDSIQLKYSNRPAQDVTDGKAEVSEQTGDKYRQGMFVIQSVSKNDKKNEDSNLSATFLNDGAPETKTAA